MVQYVEDITPEAINCFLVERIKVDNWAPKTVNLMRQVLHKFFAFAIKHHGYRSRDKRYINPAACVERLREPAPQITFLSIDEITKQLDILKEYTVISAIVLDKCS